MRWVFRDPEGTLPGQESPCRTTRELVMNAGTAWDISKEAWPPGKGVLTWPGSEAPPA